MAEIDIESLAAQFIDAHRRGERPAVEQYVSQHPELAEEIRELFPTMLALEKLKEKKQQLPPPSRLPVGIEHLGDFRIIREIGRGGMGIVYEAEQLSLGRRVAVKILPQQSLLRAKQLERFQREAMMAARLHHTNIVPVFGVGHDDGYHYIVMQFIDGVGLDEILHQLRHWMFHEDGGLETAFELNFSRSSQVSASARSLLNDRFQQQTPQDSGSSVKASVPASADGADGAASVQAETIALHDSDTRPTPGSRNGSPAAETPPAKPSVPTEPPKALEKFGAAYWRSVAKLGQQAASAMAYAHSQGTMHRDLKPGNLLLDATGHVWVADFGLAKAAEQQGISRTGDVVGTLGYMAPEQLRGEPERRSDIYSLGLTLYEMLTLQPAYDGRGGYSQLLHRVAEGKVAPPRKINAEVPRDLETIILKAIARDPEARYANAELLAQDLQCYLDDRPIQAKRASLPEHALRWSRRNPLAACLIALVASLMLAFVGVVTIAYASTNSALQEQTAEREKAERTLSISLKVLDRIYERIAPDRVSANDWSLADADADGTQSEIASTASLSPVTEAILKDLIDAYNQFAAIDTDNLELQIQAARARRRIGEIQIRLGKYEQAKTTLETALRQYELLAKQQNQQPSYVVQTARIRNSLGEVLWRQQRPEGRQQYWAALQLLANAEHPTQATNPELKTHSARLELARTLFYLGRRREHPTGVRPPSGNAPGPPRPGGHGPGGHGPGGHGPGGRGPGGHGPGPGRGPGDRGPGDRVGPPLGERREPMAREVLDNQSSHLRPAEGVGERSTHNRATQLDDALWNKIGLVALVSQRPSSANESQADTSQGKNPFSQPFDEPPELGAQRGQPPSATVPEGRSDPADQPSRPPWSDAPGARGPGARGPGARGPGPGLDPGGPEPRGAARPGRGRPDQGGPGRGGPGRGPGRGVPGRGGPGRGEPRRGEPGRGGLDGRFGRPPSFGRRRFGEGDKQGEPPLPRLGRFDDRFAKARLHEGFKFLERAIVILESLEQEVPGNTEVTRLRALCHRELALDPFSQDLIKAIDLFERLHADHPEVDDYANDLSRTLIAHLYLHERGQDIQQHHELAERLDKAHLLLESLIRMHPDDIEYASKLSLVLLERAENAIGRPGRGPVSPEQEHQAQQDLARAVKLQTRVVNKNSTSSLQLAGLTVMQYRYAETLYLQNHYQAAADILADSVARLEAARHSRLQAHLDDSRAALAKTYESLGRPDEAQQLLERVKEPSR